MEFAYIPEYSQKEVKGFHSDIDKPYLGKIFKTESNNPPFRILELKGGKVDVINTSYAGIIQLQDLRLEFSTKVKTNLFYMLSYLKNENYFIYDSEKIIDLKEGQSFFDVLGKLYLNELIKIDKFGFYKKYVNKEENLSFLKGNMIINRHIQNNIHQKFKIYCGYDDLTYDNLENQIVLRAATLLSQLIRFNATTKRNLCRYTQMMRENISLVAIRPEECNKLDIVS